MPDPLAQWLAGPGLEAIDGIAAEALDVIGVVDDKLTIRYLNWTVAGLTRDTLRGTSALNLAPPHYRDTARAAYEEVLRTGRGRRFEIVFQDGHDVQLWDVRVGPIRFERAIIGLVVVTTDVTEQRRAQADRERFFSLSLDMLIVVHEDGRLKRVNPAFGEVLGYTATELIGKPFLELVHVDDRARTRETYALVLRGVTVPDFENRYRLRNGNYRTFSWRATVDPVTRDVYAVARDVTDHRAMEARLRHSQKMEAVGKLAGGIAHDFNNLLLAVLANAELASECASEPAPLAEHLAEIEGAALRAADLTKQLLAFSRQQPMRPAIVDLNRLLANLMRLLRRLLPESIGIDFFPGDALAAVSADPSQLEQVVVNLCVNARDAMPHGGALTLDTSNVVVDERDAEAQPGMRPGRYVRLTVTDNGSGMSAEVRERAFEPFFTTKGPQQGTGLGLATVYGVVQQHNGFIFLESEPEVGTTFKIYFPADARAAGELRSDPEVEPLPGRETILIAEDEELVRRAVVQLLERAGYRIVVATNGREAVRLLGELAEPVHLVLLDVVMPEQGGPETWEQMRQMRPGLRVLFTSGYADDAYRERIPPDATVLAKPFRAEDLLKAVRHQLEAPPGGE